MVFDFTPTSPFELSVTGERLCTPKVLARSHKASFVSEGSVVRILEDDDGSGWVKVIDDSGGKGLVPASYVQVVDPSSEDIGGTAAHGSARPQGSGKRGNEPSGFHLRWRRAHDLVDPLS